MKKLIVILSLLAGAYSAQAAVQTVSSAAACKNVSFFSNSDTVKCLKENSGAIFQKKALNVCSNQFSDSTKKVCLSIIKNKKYDSVELEICSDNFSDYDKNVCLKDTGTPLVLINQCEMSQENLEDARHYARKIKRQLNRGNVLGALESLSYLLNVLR